MSPASRVTRVYVPSTTGRLRGIVTASGIGPAPFAAHAVTEEVRRALGDVDEEDLEFAASSAAALSSVRLLAEAVGDEPSRRVVVAIDVPSAVPAGTDDPTLVEVDEVVPYRRIAAVLADDAAAESDVAAAVEALRSGSPDAEGLLERCLDHQPGWWAAQEIGDLLELGGVAGA